MVHYDKPLGNLTKRLRKLEEQYELHETKIREMDSKLNEKSDEGIKCFKCNATTPSKLNPKYCINCGADLYGENKLKEEDLVPTW